MDLIVDMCKLIIKTSIAFLLFSGCANDHFGEINKQSEKIKMHFKLQLAEMNPSSLTSTRSGIKEEKSSFEIEDATRLNKTLTRSSTGVDEYAVNEVCILQFDGTASTSTLVAKEYYSSPDTTYLQTTLIQNSSDQTVYVLANVGDLTSNYTIGTTTIADFQASTLNFATEGSITSGSDLPMVGSYVGPSTPGVYSISLIRMVAKISLTCNVTLTNTSDAFELKSARLYSVANITQIDAPTSTYPQNSTIDADKYVNYTRESYATGNTLTWYIPENLRGTITKITSEENKNEINAPAYSTYIEIEGIYKPSHGAAEYVIYRFYPGANMITNFDISRNTYYNIGMIIKGMNEVDRRVAIPENLSLNNAGQQVTANCYIVNDKNRNYKFNATVMGNGATTASVTIGDQTAPAIIPTTLSPTTAFVIWETGNRGDVVEDGSVTLFDGYVRFKTADNTANGNALIGVTDGTKLLWSWHIWKTSYAPNVDVSGTYDTYVTRAIDNTATGYTGYNSIASRSFKMMKYNLGATLTGSDWNSSAANSGDLGLFYQWGRKDPFMGSKNWVYYEGTGKVPDRISTTNTLGYEWMDGLDNSTAIATTEATVSGYSGADAAIEYGRRNPTHFIFSTSTATYDWLNVSLYANQRDNLWGNPNETSAIPNTTRGSKSIYDPCPPGWRVPAQDSFTGFTTTGTNVNNDPTLYNIYGVFNKGYIFYISETSSGNTSYWPATGYIKRDTGVLYRIGNCGFCWSSSPSKASTSGTNNLGFESTLAGPLNYYSRSYGFPIRCAQEE